MEANNFTIPVPPFNTLEYIKDETTLIVNRWRSNNYMKSADEAIAFLDSLNNDNQKLQSLTLMIHLVGYKYHLHLHGDSENKIMPTISNPQIDRHLKHLIFVLYGLIEKFGVNPYDDQFTPQETYENNQKLTKMQDAIDKLLGGQEIIFDEIQIVLLNQARQSLEDAKGLQILGKQKWHIFVGGIIAQMSTEEVLKFLWINYLAVSFKAILGFAFNKITGS